MKQQEDNPEAAESQNTSYQCEDPPCLKQAVPRVTVNTKSTDGGATSRFLLLVQHQSSNCNDAQTNKRRPTYCAWIKSKTEPLSKWKCTPCWAQPIMCRRTGLGLRGIELSRGYLQVLAPSPWLRATDQRSRVWLQSTGDQDRDEKGPRSGQVGLDKNGVAVLLICKTKSQRYLNDTFLYFLLLSLSSSREVWPFLFLLFLSGSNFTKTDAVMCGFCYINQ